MGLSKLAAPFGWPELSSTCGQSHMVKLLLLDSNIHAVEKTILVFQWVVK